MPLGGKPEAESDGAHLALQDQNVHYSGTIAGGDYLV